MNARSARATVLVATAALLAACTGDSTEVPSAPTGEPVFQSFANSEWSDPVHLDPPISSPARELGAVLSPDELSIYFASDRPGGLGDVDIWVARRDCRDCAWGEAVSLGPNVNSPKSDGGPAFSADGHMMFFSSNRDGTLGGDDLWVTYRTNVNDDLGWGPAINLGPLVNTAAGHEGGPSFVLVGPGPATLYFSRSGDIYEVSVTHEGEALANAVPVTELNHPTANDNEASVRGDGRELVFWSNRPGALGANDIWVATRDNVHEPWSTPRNLGPTINTPSADLTPRLSRDGRTLLWSAAANARPSLGFQDVWMSTRTPSGQ
jgi:hypothetical protein